jgi:UDP-N-acetylglucosamine transferase subunit ALG13
MIFVTVGTQLPFDRLIRTIDQWSSRQPSVEVFAQIGPAEYQPRHIAWAEFLDADECRRKTEKADVVVAHAGMGSILTALELGRPVLVMPRLSAYGEHRNDHQLDTAKKLLAQGRIFVAFDEVELVEKLDLITNLKAAERISVQASAGLLEALRGFVNGQMPAVKPKVDAATTLAPPRLFRGGLLGTDAGVLVIEKEQSDGGAASGTDHSRRTSEHAEGTNGYGLNGSFLSEAKVLEVRDRSEFGFQRGESTHPENIRAGLAAVVLLAGRLRATELGKRISRNRLDLPVDDRRSMLCYWRDEVTRLATSWDVAHIALRVLLDQESATPVLPPFVPGMTLTIERDESDFRGTGGVLHDVCTGYPDDAWVLVTSAAQILFQPLAEIADRMARAGGDVNVMNDEEGIPNGLMLLRCGMLRQIPEVGYHDMKEQVVPAISGRRSVKVVSGRGIASRPIHSLADYIESLRRFHGGPSRAEDDDTFGERWKSQFGIREQGSVVASSAVVHDSVILEGAVVDADAVVVRSVVGRGTRVGPGEVVVATVVSAVE